MKLPDKYLFASRAIVNEYTRHYEKALTEWKLVGHYERMHSILLRKILPLYFHMHYSSTEQLELLLKNKELIRQYLQLIKANKDTPFVRNFQQRGHIVLEFLNLISNGKNQQLHSEINYLIKISMIDNDIIEKFIESFLRNWENQFKISKFTKDTIGSQDIPLIAASL